jgi:hypothetical protein
MRLRSADNAIIGPAKIRDYLLSREHPIGRFKATFFETLGYTRSAWRVLERDIRLLASSEEGVNGHSSRFGEKFEVSGTITGPSGRSATLVTVWIILNGESVPRFVTAFPGDSR